LVQLFPVPLLADSEFAVVLLLEEPEDAALLLLEEPELLLVEEEEPDRMGQLEGEGRMLKGSDG
jgi:hypothetical protein